MTGTHGAAFAEWSDGQRDDAAAFVRELGRLMDRRDMTLAEADAERERAHEHAWRAFHTDMVSALAALSDSAAVREQFWLSEVKPGHPELTAGPPGAVTGRDAPAGDTHGNVRVVYPGAIPSDSDLGFTPGKAGPGDLAGPPGVLP